MSTSAEAIHSANHLNPREQIILATLQQGISVYTEAGLRLAALYEELGIDLPVPSNQTPFIEYPSVLNLRHTGLLAIVHEGRIVEGFRQTTPVPGQFILTPATPGYEFEDVQFRGRQGTPDNIVRLLDAARQSLLVQGSERHLNSRLQKAQIYH